MHLTSVVQLHHSDEEGEKPSIAGSAKEVNPHTFESLPARTPIDHTIGTKRLESSLERLDFVHLVVLLNVFFPQIRTIFRIVAIFIRDFHTLNI